MNIPTLDLPARLLMLRPPRVAMALVLLAGCAHLLAPVTLWRAPVGPALALVLAGFLTMLHAWWLFRLARTPICPTARATTLITGGVYAFSRNPMYLGIFVMLLGVALVAGTVPFYLAALVFFAVIDRVFCPFEERQLEAMFGATYRSYRSRVRRWI